ncbi:MAG: hypothetical protein WBQ23_02395 [Bacteroidota bacterium]
MKKIFLLVFLASLLTVNIDAQTINFEPSTVITGSMGPFNSPQTAGVALKATYPQIYDWDEQFQVDANVTRNSFNYNKALLFEDDDAWMKFGPLAGGSFFFTMLTHSNGNGNNYYYTECQVRVYTSSHTQVGNTQTFAVSNQSPINGAAFCNVSQLVPANGYVRIKSVDHDFRKFYIDEISGAGGPLPVELTSFRSYLKDDQVELQWTTATELNNFGFDVERSTDGNTWSALGFVAGFGTSSSPKQYSFRDAELDRSTGTLYYRLKQMDRDGTTDYSDILRVALAAPTSVQLSAYPQPFAGSLNVDLSSMSSEQVTVTLYNSAMQKISSVYEGMVDGNMSLTVPTTDLRDGSYFLIVNHASGETQVQKLMHLQSK